MVTAWETFTHSGASVTRTITGLTADTEYQVRVQALNGETPSAWSDPSEAVRTNTEMTLSSDATLSSLELSGIMLNPAVSSGIISYTASVSNTVSSTTVMAATTDPNASSVVIKRNGVVDSDGTVNLEVGANTITVEVTAEDDTNNQTYTVTVNRVAADTSTTCTLNTGDIWCGVVTVARHSAGQIQAGYGFVDAATDTGALSETGFSVPNDGGTNSYTIDAVWVSTSEIGGGAGTLNFGLTSQLAAADRAKLVLQVGSAEFAFSDAEEIERTFRYKWTNSGLDWSSQSMVTLRLQLIPADEPVEVTLQLSDADGEVDEDAGEVTVTATVSPASATAFTVTVSASPVAPATVDDFELSTNRELSFDANATGSTGTVTITPVDDNNAESTQVVTVSGSASIAGVTGPTDVTLTILDNDPVDIQGICDRTERVRDRMLVLLQYLHSFKGECGDVNDTHLAKLEALDLGPNPSTGESVTLILQSNDFEGLVNLERLYLRDTGLSSLPVRGVL